MNKDFDWVKANFFAIAGLTVAGVTFAFDEYHQYADMKEAVLEQKIHNEKVEKSMSDFGSQRAVFDERTDYIIDQLKQIRTDMKEYHTK